MFPWTTYKLVNSFHPPCPGPQDPATHTQRVEKFLPRPSRVRKLGSSSNLRPARPDTSVSPSPSPSPPRLRSSLIIISKSPARLSWTNLIINNDQDQPPSWPVLAPRPGHRTMTRHDDGDQEREQRHHPASHRVVTGWMTARAGNEGPRPTEFSQSQRRPLLGPSAVWKLSHFPHH